MAKNLSVDAGIKMAARHPHSCASLLATNLYPLLEQQAWFDKEWRARFCAYFLQNMADQSIEDEVDVELMSRIGKLPLQRCLPLIERAPCAGLKVLVAIISQGLRQEQKLTIAQQYEFYNLLFGKFFPEARG